jgi:opacity protein-like surface antigen
MLRTAGWALAVAFVLTSIGSAQEQGRFDVSIGGAGVFSKTSTSSNGTVTLKPTSSGAILATFRYCFNRMHGIEGNIGHTINSQVFFIPPDNYRIHAGVTEYSGAYVFSPFQTARIEPFLFGGAGALRFNPDKTYIDGFQSAFGASKQTSLAFLYGGGADYHLWRFLALRLQYRGLIYKAPNFTVPILFTGAKGHMAEPAAGIVVKF